MRLASILGLVALAVPVAAGGVRAGEAAAIDRAASDAVARPEVPGALDAQRRRLEAAVAAAASAEAERRRTEGDLDAIRADRARLSTALVDAASRVRDAETRSTAVEGRLDRIAGSEEAIRRSLAGRRDEAARVLAALQRLGLHPPPALLARPDDAVDALRSAALLGAVVPELRAAARALTADLGELGRLRALAAGERDALAAETAALGAERSRLSTLVEARRAAQSAAETALDGDRQRAAALARDATSLKDLVGRLEGDAAAARRAAEADAAGVAAKAVAAAGARDPARLAPAVPFGDTRGRLTLPVAGRIVRTFGAADDVGGQGRGQSLATRPGAVVASPADGWVSFSGPYRSYGQILIMTMGDGYYVVLAGLARIDVAPGQFVLAGEPLGAMGDGPAKVSGAAGAASAIALGAGDPVLYVEFRKDGAAIDPAPWWAKADSQKVRG